MAIDIGTLKARVVADTGSFDRDIGKATAALGGLGKIAGPAGMAVAAVGTAAAAMGGAALIAAKQTFDLAQSVANVGDNASKTGQAIGVTAEAYQELTHAAELSGLSQGELESGLRRLTRSASDANEGLMESKRAYDALDISVTKADGTLKDTDELLGDVAERFSQMEDSAQKTARAQELFGRSGAKMIPLLNQGRDGISAMREEAKELGIVLSNETSAASEEFNDSLLRMKSSFKGMKLSIGSNLIEPMTVLFKQATATSQALKGLGSGFFDTSGLALGLATSAVHVADGLIALAPQIVVATQAIKAMSAGFTIAASGVSALVGILAGSLLKKIKQFADAAKFLAEATGQKGMAWALGQASDAIESFDKTIADKTAAHVKKVKANIDDLTDALANLEPNTAANQNRIGELQKRLAGWREELKNIQLDLLNKKTNESTDALKSQENQLRKNTKAVENYAGAFEGLTLEDFGGLSGPWNEAELEGLLMGLAPKSTDFQANGEATGAAQSTGQNAAQAQRSAAASIAGAAGGNIAALGNVAAGAAQGAAVGGPVGAVAGAAPGVIGMLKERSSAFADLLDQINKILDPIMDALGAVIDGALALIKPALDALIKPMQESAQRIQKLAEIVGLAAEAFSMLQIGFQGIGSVFDLLDPILAQTKKALMSFKKILEPLASAFKPVMDAFKAIGAALSPFKGGGFGRALFGLLKGFAIGVTYLAEGINFVLKNTVGFFAKFISKVADFLAGGLRKLGFKKLANQIEDFSDAAGGLVDGFTESMQEIRRARDEIKATTYDSALTGTGSDTGGDHQSGSIPIVEKNMEVIYDGSVKAAEGLATLATATTEATNAMRNVPEVFRANLRRFQSSAPEFGDSLSRSAAAREATGFEKGVTHNYGPVTVVAMDPREFEKKMEREEYSRSGTTDWNKGRSYF